VAKRGPGGNFPQGNSPLGLTGKPLIRTPKPKKPPGFFLGGDPNRAVLISRGKNSNRGQKGGWNRANFKPMAAHRGFPTHQKGGIYKHPFRGDPIFKKPRGETPPVLEPPGCVWKKPPPGGGKTKPGGG